MTKAFPRFERDFRIGTFGLSRFRKIWSAIQGTADLWGTSVEQRGVDATALDRPVKPMPAAGSSHYRIRR
jgi:hypothetical protein